GRSLVRQRQLLMYEFGLAALVTEAHPGLLFLHPRTMAIGGSRDDAASRSAADHLCPYEHDRHAIRDASQACRFSDVYCALEQIGLPRPIPSLGMRPCGRRPKMSLAARWKLASFTIRFYTV